MRRNIFVTLGLLILALMGTAAEAQRGPVVYRLGEESVYNEGCYPPCRCALHIGEDLRGTFVLTYSYSDMWYDYYDVSGVNWFYTFGHGEHHVTGGGVYQVGGDFALTQRLTLRLSTDGGDSVAFDSGEIPGTDFPKINIAIADNGFYCYNRAFDIVSAPVKESEISQYSFRRSRYDEGCLFGPCDCAVQEWSVTGGFDLVPLPSSGPLVQEYAVINYRAETVGPFDPPDRSFTGLGRYVIDDTGIVRHHRMVLRLDEPTIGSHRFDSGDVVGGGGGPARIDIDLAVNGFYCSDYMFFLHAFQN